MQRINYWLANRSEITQKRADYETLNEDEMATQMMASTSSTRRQAATRTRVTIMDQNSPQRKSAT
jgi:hypothetical protein